MIEAEFSTWEGCELHSLTYGGDDACSEENVAWMNELRDEETSPEPFTQCVLFESSFHSPVEQRDAWDADTEYEGWQWWLARSRGWGVDAPDMGLLICGGKAAGQQWKGAVDMKEAKRAWWRVPVFCVLAGQVCFRLELALGRRFAIIRLSDGSVSVNNERWLLISAALFAGNSPCRRSVVFPKTDQR